MKVSPTCCTSDEGRPLDVADQAEASNHHELRSLRVIVVSVIGKGGNHSVMYEQLRRTKVNHRPSVEN